MAGPPNVTWRSAHIVGLLTFNGESLLSDLDQLASEGTHTVFIGEHKETHRLHEHNS